MRAVNVAFNIYVASSAGEVAMGLYSLILGVYSFFLTFAASSINLGVTRLISEADGKNDPYLASRCMKISLMFCTLTGGVATFIMLISSKLISYKFIDGMCLMSIKVMAFSLLPISLCSCISGYFTAKRQVKLSSFLLTFINALKIIITIFLLNIFIPSGDEYACLALSLGLTSCEILSCTANMILYLIHRTKHKAEIIKASDVNNKEILKSLTSITLPVTFASAVRSLLTSFSHMLIPKGLKIYGNSMSSALSSYGLLQGVVLPLVLFPSAIISSYSGLLIPEVSECRVRGDFKRLSRISYRILTISLFFSIAVSGVMAFLAYDIGNTVYSSHEVGDYIKKLAPLIPIMYIDSSVDAILKGMNKQIYSMAVNIIDAATACIIIFILVPKIGVYGYIISIYVTEILNTTLSLTGMIKCARPNLKIFHQVVLPIFSICTSTYISNLILKILHHPFSPIVELILHISLVLILYAVFMILTRAFGKDEKEIFFEALIKKKEQT